MKHGQDRSIAARLAGLRGFAFDLDGTIWEGPRLMPGAVELVDALRGDEIPVVFASNSSRHGARVLHGRLAGLGIESAPDEMLAALDLAGEEVARRMGAVRVLALGTDELEDVLVSSGHALVPEHEWKSAQAVVVGIDPLFSYDRLRAASRAVAAGAAFFAVNMDHRFPVGLGEFDPGCGALAEAIAVASGGQPVGIGKPEIPLFRAAIKRLGCEAHQAAMVGDSTASDIEGGRAAGMFTVWLNTESDVPAPDCVDLRVRNLGELLRAWHEARGGRV
ncbi:MAG: HAD-IIA family hydrolase [Isosphaeraceae bacterium]